MKVEPAAALVGHVAVPGDKSISHRSVLVGALAEDETHVTGFGRSADTESTIAAVRALGVRVDEPEDDLVVVHGVGLRGLRAPHNLAQTTNSSSRRGRAHAGPSSN